MTESYPQPQRETLELLNAEFASRLSRQNDSGARIENKATVVAGFAAAAAQFLASNPARAVLAIIAYSFYGLSLLSGILAIAVARYKDMSPKPLLDEYGRKPPEAALRVLVAARVHAFDANARKHRIKAILWWVSVVALTVGLVLSIIALRQTR